MVGGLSRGQLARKSGVHVETIRYYDRLELLGAVARTARGDRQFPPEAIERLALVRQARFIGLSLEEIRIVLSPAPAQAHAAAVATAIDRRLSAAQALREYLRNRSGE